MIYVISKSLDIGDFNKAAGVFRNFLILDTRRLQTMESLRVVKLSIGRASRDFGEIPGITINLDHNVVVDLVRTTLTPVTDTVANSSYGQIDRLPDDSVAGSENPASALLSTGFVTYLNNGLIGNDLNSTTPDAAASWHCGFQVRRGIRKRWNWEQAPRIGRDPVTGFAECLILRVAYFRVANLLTRLSLNMELMASDKAA